MRVVKAGSHHAEDMADKEKDTMESFDWKQKFDVSYTCLDSTDGFDRYHIENETGDGTIAACTVFPGLEAILLDLRLRRCDAPLTLNKDVIDMGYCIDGRFECTVNRQYCYFASAGDFSLGFFGKQESRGRFPTKRYLGINIFLDVKQFSQYHAKVLQDLDIRMERIYALADMRSRCYVLRHSPELTAIETAIADGFQGKNRSQLKIRMMELLLFLSNLDPTASHETPIYLNKRHAALAEAVHERLTANGFGHVTIDRLAAELGVSVTALKMSFKSVYGAPIYQYQKDLRLQKSQQLLRETTLPVAAIAEEVGYTNPAKFSSAFKKRFGVSPTEYKKSTIGTAIKFPVDIAP